MRIAALALALALSACASVRLPTAEAPDSDPLGLTLSQQGCSIAADMALVARSLSAEKIAPEQARRITALVYENFSDGGPQDRIRRRITDFAYGREEKPIDLAAMVGKVCLMTGGDLDAAMRARANGTGI